jgi:excinuclease ABC subunit A
MDDVKKLIRVLNRLAEGGNTIIVIEHNMDVIKCADYVLDMGPKGGNEGGRIIAQGIPEQIAQNKNSATGAYLQKIFSV